MKQIEYLNEDYDIKSLRRTKPVKIIVHGGESDYLYVECSNGDRMKVLRPEPKKQRS